MTNGTCWGYRLLVPDGWQRIDLAADRDQQIERIVSHATGHLDRDSAAVRKHWVRAQLDQMAEQFAEADSALRPLSLLFPLSREAQPTMTASMVVSALDAPPGDARSVEVLVELARRDPTSRPIEAAGSVAVRTHEFRDMTPQFDATMDAAEMSDGDRESIREEAPEKMYALRATYVLAREDPRLWLSIAGSAVVPTAGADDEINAAFLELFDAVLGTLTWTEAS